MISSRLERLPNSPKPQLFKAKSASNIRPHIDPMIHVLEKKHFTQGCAGLICAPNSIHSMSIVILPNIYPHGTSETAPLPPPPPNMVSYGYLSPSPHISYLCTYDLYSPVFRVFWAPNGICLSARCHFTGSKTLDFQGPTPSHLPS
jgi:hypothetical protein